MSTGQASAADCPAGASGVSGEIPKNASEKRQRLPARRASKFPPPLRITIPLLLFLFGLVMILTTFRVHVAYHLRKYEGSTIRRLTANGTRLAGMAEYFAATLDTNGLLNEVRLSAIAPGFHLAAVCDEREKIIVAQEKQWAGKFLGQTPLAMAVPACGPARTARTNEVFVTEDERSTVGVFPFVLPGKSAAGGARIGMVVLVFDLMQAEAEAKRESFGEVILFSGILALLCLAMWLALNSLLTARVSALIHATRRIAAGDMVSGAALRGGDELAVLAEALNDMGRELEERAAARRKAEGQLAEYATELANKNKELETIVYLVSHDLRSPLVNVEGFSKELGRACKELQSKVTGTSHDPMAVDSEVKEILEVEIPRALRFIGTAVTKMGALLSGFLRFSRLGRDALQFHAVDMERLLSSTTEGLRLQIEEAQAVVRVESLPRCWGDSMHLGQVFSNLIDNAIKYRDPHRPLTVVISGRTEGNTAVYGVADNGIGIAAEHQGKIFEMFHRLDPRGVAGEGLGLAIAQRILERQHGRIWVESEAGRGSTFFVTMPLPPASSF